MIPELAFIFFLLALWCFVTAALAPWKRVNLLALGLAIWVLVPLFDCVKAF